MKLFRNRYFIAVICLAIAAAIALIALPKLYRDEAATTNIVRVTEVVSRGTKITADMLTVETVGAYNLPEGVIQEKNSLIGYYAAADLLPSDILVASKFTSTAPLLAEVDATEYRLRDDEFLVTISVPNMAATTAGMLAKNSFVTLTYHNGSKHNQKVATVETVEDEEDWDWENNKPKDKEVIVVDTEDEDETDFYNKCMFVPDLLRDLRVYSIKNSDMQDIDELKFKVDAGELLLADVNLTPAYLTFAVTEEQAKALLAIGYDYPYHFIFDYNTTKRVAEDASAALEAQKKAQLNAEAAGDEQ